MWEKGFVLGGEYAYRGPSEKGGRRKGDFRIDGRFLRMRKGERGGGERVETMYRGRVIRRPLKEESSCVGGPEKSLEARHYGSHSIEKLRGEAKCYFSVKRPSGITWEEIRRYFFRALNSKGGERTKHNVSSLSGQLSWRGGFGERGARLGKKVLAL